MRLRYDDSSDILVLQRTEGEPMDRLILDNIIVDLSSTNTVRGLEIRKASKFFNCCKKDMCQARDADLYPTSRSLMLEITLKTRGSARPARIAVPIEIP